VGGATPKVEAKAAILVNSERPPQAAMSGCMMETQGPPGPAIMSRKPNLMKEHSPPAIGMDVLACTLLYPSISSGTTGSSNQRTSKRSIPLASLIAVGTECAWFESTIRPI